MIRVEALMNGYSNFQHWYLYQMCVLSCCITTCQIWWGVVGGKATDYIHYSSVMSLDVTPRLITYVLGNMGICKQICTRRRERLGEGVIKWEL